MFPVTYGLYSQVDLVEAFGQVHASLGNYLEVALPLDDDEFSALPDLGFPPISRQEETTLQIQFLDFNTCLQPESPDNTVFSQNIRHAAHSMSPSFFARGSRKVAHSGRLDYLGLEGDARAFLGSHIPIFLVCENGSQI